MWSRFALTTVVPAIAMVWSSAAYGACAWYIKASHPTITRNQIREFQVEGESQAQAYEAARRYRDVGYQIYEWPYMKCGGGGGGGGGGGTQPPGYSVWYFRCSAERRWTLYATYGSQAAADYISRQLSNDQTKTTVLPQGQSPNWNPCPASISFTACAFQYYHRYRGQWLNYRGQIANYRPLGTCTAETTQRWYAEVISVAQQVNGVRITQSNVNSFVRYVCQPYPSSSYYCSNGYLFMR
jgi:hypothetical protein